MKRQTEGEPDSLIFISIASYRDIQLVPTVEDLLAKADDPSRLRFGICWQHGDEQPSLPFRDNPRFRILDVPWHQSRGACWARAGIMKLWHGEQWFLQTDSHCRFRHGWDTRLIRMMAETGSPKPILSTYANGFTPSVVNPAGPASRTKEIGGTKEILDGAPNLMALDDFADDVFPKLKPLAIPGFGARTRPMAARFLAAGFLFAPGSFVEEVPYDPELYFFGEEISMTVRAFTSGYDLFHPVETVAWHDYVRSYATRHWDDHAAAKTVEAGTAPAWGELDQRSRQKVRALLTGASEGNSPTRFGLGNVRTLEEYEAYAGISFQHRKVQDYTRLALEPPNPPAPADWPDRIYTWLVRIIFNTAALSPCAFDPSGFWMVTVLDEDGREIRRHDFSKDELRVFTSKDPRIVLVCEIRSGIIPRGWTVWPYSRERGWGRRFEGRFSEADFSIIKEDADSPDDAPDDSPDDEEEASIQPLGDAAP